LLMVKWRIWQHNKTKSGIAGREHTAVYDVDLDLDIRVSGRRQAFNAETEHQTERQHPPDNQDDRETLCKKADTSGGSSRLRSGLAVM